MNMKECIGDMQRDTITRGNDVAPTPYTEVRECADRIIRDLDKNITLGIPLGIGKPVQIVNELYRRAKEDNSIKLKIMTALSLERPGTAPGLESKFLNPVFDRIFKGYVGPEYARDVRNQSLPPNVDVSEFFFKSGSMMHNDYAQQHYISCNYTHVARDMIDAGVNLLAQQVSRGEYQGKEYLSLSSNTDVTFDLLPLIRQEQACGRTIKIVGQVNQNLPFMVNDALAEAGEFDYLIDNPNYYTRLFAPPNLPVSPTDFAIGMHASALIRDGGTLQIGIGSMGDAIVYSCLLRESQNETYQTILKQLGHENYAVLAGRIGGKQPFERGLYGSSEMFVNGFLHLIQNNIVKRKVYDNVYIQKLVNEGRLSESITADNLDDLVDFGFFGDTFHRQDIETALHFGIFNERVQWKDHQLYLDTDALGYDPYHLPTITRLKSEGMGTHLKHGIILHGGFFLGPNSFYDALHAMSEEERAQICMTSVGHVNQLLVNEELAMAQRRDARFINTGLMATLNGAVVSDGLENGKIVSGVGGQYNFVSMAHALPGARSILLVRSTRSGKDGVSSNIVYNYGHITIPRHLRDIIITEYGVADLRGKTDSEVMQAMINVADSRFQTSLLAEAKKHGKIPKDYQIPQAFRNNTPERVNDVIASYRAQGLFPALPLGTDFTETELKIGACLKQLKALSQDRVKMLTTLFKAWREPFDEDKARPYLERMDLARTASVKEKIEQRLFLYQLKLNGNL